MSICTLCYLYSLAICYKTNRKSKLEDSHFDQLSSVQRGRGPGETFWWANTRSFYCACCENGWRRWWPGSAFAAATLQLLQGRRRRDAHRGQLESSKRLHEGLQCIIVLPWLGCFAAKVERVSVPATLLALYHSTETMVSKYILRCIKGTSNVFYIDGGWVWSMRRVKEE